MKRSLQPQKGHAARLVHMGSRSGHREAYQTLFADQFSLSPSTGKVSLRNFVALVQAEALLLGTIDDDYAGFFIVSLVRASLGRRTVGLFLRPQSCFQQESIAYILKRFAFKALKLVSLISVFTIVPFEVVPKYESVASKGLLDPQMWDLDPSRLDQADTAFAAAIRASAAGRRVLAFIGTAHVGKGIEFLRDLIMDAEWPSDLLFPVIAGRFPDEVCKLPQQLSDRDALVIDRVISDNELFALYSEADFIWACYKPDYDQASGVFGRAIQLGKTPIVRARSVISSIAEYAQISTIELDYGAPAQAVKLRSEVKEMLREACMPAKIAQWRHRFEAAIRDAL